MESFQFPNQLTLKNRLLLAPMTTDSGTPLGGLSQEDCDFILRRSNDFGAVIIGSHSVSETGSAFERGWNIYNPRNHAMLKQLVAKLHQQDVKVFIQLYHAGRLAQPAFIGNLQPIAPSRIPAKRTFASYPREMSPDEIKDVIQSFQNATRIAGELGMDGVEIHGANTYLVQQFYSPHSNRRTDEWGGSRLRFPLQVIEACLAAKPERPFVVGYRFSPEEYETPGIRLDDTVRLLKKIATYPLDYMHISLSDFHKKSLDGRPIMEELEKVVALPFIGCGNISTREQVEDVLNRLPLVSVGNASLIDPDWASKITQEYGVIRTVNPERHTMPEGLWRLINESPQRYFDFTKEES